LSVFGHRFLANGYRPGRPLFISTSINREKVVPTVSARPFPRLKKRPVGRFPGSLLAQVRAAVLATENRSWLADEAIARGIPVIVSAAVAVIVGI
jgi:hypothetical protein